jgi:asparagine synthase (glutamine-hydrolysing)
MSNAYRTGLQRLDRSFSAHGIEYRTPFLDRRVVNFCNQIPNEWKIYGPEKIEKWILRKAYENDLPNNIVNRRKEPFANGSGVSDIIKDISQQKVSEFERRPSTFQNLDVDWEFTSPAEFYYYRLFKEFFPDKSYERLVTRWDPLLK